MGTGKSLKRAKKIRAKKSQLPNFFSPVLDFSPSPLTAPGSPRMHLIIQFLKFLHEELWQAQRELLLALAQGVEIRVTKPHIKIKKMIILNKE